MKQKFPRTGPQKRVLVGTAGMSKPAKEAFAKAVDAAVCKEIADMWEEEFWLPEQWSNLYWAMSDLGTEKFGDSTNQRLLKRDRIEKIEAMCRAIGAGGTYFASKPVNH